jgi:carbamoyl-phosphate synthase small subunit
MFARSIIRLPTTLSRGFATHTGPLSALPATLHLKTGQSFHGRSFGSPRSVFGETVFSTSITSCMSNYCSSNVPTIHHLIL